MAAAVTLPFLIVDTVFFSATSLKVLQGGWFPLLIGCSAFFLMATWKAGRDILSHRLNSETMPLNLFVNSIGASAGQTVPNANAQAAVISQALKVAGLSVDDIDLWEVNEAFAVVAEKFIRDLKLDRNKVNVNGGACALGHPIGATGSILIGTVLDELERRGLKRGLVTMCAAGGMAPAIIIERV